MKMKSREDLPPDWLQDTNSRSYVKNMETVRLRYRK